MTHPQPVLIVPMTMDAVMVAERALASYIHTLGHIMSIDARDEVEDDQMFAAALMRGQAIDLYENLCAGAGVPAEQIAEQLAALDDCGDED